MRNVLAVRRETSSQDRFSWMEKDFYELLIFKGNIENITFRNSNFSPGYMKVLKKHVKYEFFFIFSCFDNPNGP
jgi:hypothetical protein